MAELTTGRVGAAGRPLQRADDPPLSPIFMIAMASLVVPMSFDVGTLYMSVSRTVFLILMPILTVRFLAGHYGPILMTDKLIMGYFGWFTLSTLIKNAPVFLTFAGSNLMIQFGGYLLGRAFVTGPKSFRQFVIFYGCLILLIFPFAVYETITSYMPVARLIDQIPGITASRDVNYDPRRGMERVQFAFAHPIHFGIFSTVIFGMVLISLRGYINGALRWLWSLLIALCCLFSVSSGPFLGIVIQVMLACYGVMMRSVQRPWILLLRVGGVGYVILDLASNRPAYYAIVERLAFNTGTAYVRKILLDFGIEQIGRTPLFGIGAGRRMPLPHWMTGSMDNHWLLIAVAYGLPAMLLLMGAYVYAIWKSGKQDLEGDTELQNMQLGWSIASVGTMMTLATVAIWSEIATIIFVVFGTGVWLTTAKARRGDEAPPVSETDSRRDRRPRYTRFPPEDRGVLASGRSPSLDT